MEKISKKRLDKLIAQAETKLEKAKEQLSDTSTDNCIAAAKTLITLSSDILLSIVSRQSLEYRQEIVDEIADVLNVCETETYL